METIKKTKTNIITEYKCEVCKKIHLYAIDAERCEKSHTCKHEPIFEFVSPTSESWWFNTDGIKSECKLCSQHFGKVDFEEIEYNQEIMRAIYELLKPKR